MEDYITLLQEKMVAYINVDVAASGNLKFKPAATPNFRYTGVQCTGRASFGDVICYILFGYVLLI